MTPAEREEVIIRSAARLYEARETMRNLFRDEYEGKIHDWRRVVRGCMAKQKLGAVEAFLFIVRDARDEGHELGEGSLIWLMAATVDVSEGK